MGLSASVREQVEGAADLLRRVAALGQVGGEQAFLDVAVAGAVGPIAEIAVAEFVAEQGDDPVLRGAFWLADGAHTSLVLPVSNSCIMPCLRARVLSRRCSSAASSASMSDSTSAMAVCSVLSEAEFGTAQQSSAIRCCDMCPTLSRNWLDLSGHVSECRERQANSLG